MLGWRVGQSRLSLDNTVHCPTSHSTLWEQTHLRCSSFLTLKSADGSDIPLYVQVKQRIIDVDTKNSLGLVGHIEELSHNALAVYWNPLESPAKVNLAVQCLSTDFR